MKNILILALFLFKSNIALALSYGTSNSEPYEPTFLGIFFDNLFLNMGMITLLFLLATVTSFLSIVVNLAVRKNHLRGFSFTKVLSHTKNFLWILLLLGILLAGFGAFGTW